MEFFSRLRSKAFLSVCLAAFLSFFASAGRAGAEGQSIALREGFNFAAVTVVCDRGTAALMAENPAVREIYLYSAAAGTFLTAASGDIATLIPGRGYIIRSSGGAVLELQGPVAGAPGDIKLKAGFNLAGFSSAVAPIKFSALMAVCPSVKGIYKWSGASGGFIQVVRVNGRPEAIDGADPEIRAGESYFINMAADAVLNYDSGDIKITSQAAEEPQPSKPYLTGLETDRNDISLDADSSYDLSIISVAAVFSDGSSAAVPGDWKVLSGGSVAGGTFRPSPAASEALLETVYTAGAIVKTCALRFKINRVPVSLALSQSSDSVARGGEYDLSSLKAVVAYSDGSTKEAAVTYSCDSAPVVNNRYQASGPAGTAYIKASYSEGSRTLSFVFVLTVTAPEVDVADYFPLRREDLYYYSNGQDVIDFSIAGEIYAAGVMATKFSSRANGSFDCYRLDETGLYICDVTANRPTKLCNKYPVLNENCVSYVNNSIGSVIFTCTVVDRGAYSVPGGQFADVVVIEQKMTANGVSSYMYFYLARGVGLIKSATNLTQFELVGGTIGGRSYSPSKKKWTFLIYSCGDNDSGDISPILIQEIKGYKNTDIERDANIVVQLSPSRTYYSNPYNSEFYNVSTSRYYLKDGGFYRVFSRMNQHTNNGDKNELSGFLNWGVTAFPAERYAVIISAHGSGIISVLGGPAAAPKRSIAYDDHPYDYLDAIEYKNVFAGLKAKIGKNIDIIAFDSCIMGMLEVAYQIRNSADYFVASEAAALERDTGLFSMKFNALADKNPLAVSKALVDSYVDSPKMAGKSVTMSVVDLSKVNYAASCMNGIASLWLAGNLNDTEFNAFYDSIYYSQRFGPPSYYDFSTCYIDMFDMASIMSQRAGIGNLKKQADAILAFKNQLVPYSRATGAYYPRAAGLSIFVPKYSTQWYNSNMTSNFIREQYLYYNDFGATTSWGAFLDSWARLLYRVGY